jgi:uncharacterized cupredoxin-like copper-binding protein
MRAVRPKTFFVGIALASLSVGTMVACSSSSSSSEPGGSGSSSVATSESPEGATVNATVKDFSVAVDQSSVPAGEITFVVTNEGPTVHEFVVLKTDLPADQLPVENDAVTEDADGIENAGEVEDVASGASEDLALQLEPGNYVLVCNIEGHYAQGMHTAFTVT